VNTETLSISVEPKLAKHIRETARKAESSVSAVLEFCYLYHARSESPTAMAHFLKQTGFVRGKRRK
jgi:hypothetical protein